mgnify:CR=1 FL=1
MPDNPFAPGQTPEQVSSERLPAARPWSWVPSLYFLEGLPYVVANNLSVAMYKSLSVSNSQIAFLTSWLSLVWAFKALWSPLVDGVSTKRRWVVAMQLAIAPALFGLMVSLQLPSFVLYSMIGFFVVGFLSATHDIAADGLYILALSDDQQAAWVGIRSTFWRLALVFGEGGLLVLAGWLGEQHGAIVGWQLTLLATAALFVAGAVFHGLLLPRAPDDTPREQPVQQAWVDAVRSFFAKPDLLRGLAIILFFRFAENHMAKLVVPFLMDDADAGGLGMSLTEVGVAKGTVGVLCLVAGGILGGLAIYAHGLRRWLWPMVVALNVPNLVYVYLAWFQPADRVLINALIGVESFGYGFGFSAYMMYLIHFARGEYETTHYAFATGLMATAVWAAQFWSGWVSDSLGYQGFFLWVVALTLPGFAVAALVDVSEDFGKRTGS